MMGENKMKHQLSETISLHHRYDQITGAFDRVKIHIYTL